MARYDRRILLPYLRNVYTLEVFIQQRRAAHESMRCRLQALEADLALDAPPQKVPHPSPVAPLLLGFASLLLCCIAGMLGMLALSGSQFRIPFGVLLLICLVFLLLFSKKWSDYRKQNREFQQYCEAAEQYVQRSAGRSSLVQQIEDRKKELTLAAAQCNEAVILIHTLYNLNVIPVQYRTLSAVRYLFDYFLSSKADDIDTVLQSYAVEREKDNALHTDPRKARLLLHQRARLAENTLGDLAQKQYYETQMMQIVDAETHPDLHNQYLKMVHADLSVSRFFVQNDFDAE